MSNTKKEIEQRKKLEGMTLFGIGHWPLENDLSEFTEWGIEITTQKQTTKGMEITTDELQTVLKNHDAVKFYNAIQKFIPENYIKYIQPSGKGTYRCNILNLPVIDIAHHNKAYEILQKYFSELKE